MTFRDAQSRRSTHTELFDILRTASLQFDRCLKSRVSQRYKIWNGIRWQPRLWNALRGIQKDTRPSDPVRNSSEVKRGAEHTKEFRPSWNSSVGMFLRKSRQGLKARIFRHVCSVVFRHHALLFASLYRTCYSSSTRGVDYKGITWTTCSCPDFVKCVFPQTLGIVLRLSQLCEEFSILLPSHENWSNVKK